MPKNKTFLIAVLATAILLLYCQTYVAGAASAAATINDNDSTNPLNNAEEEVDDDKERGERSAYRHQYPPWKKWGGSPSSDFHGGVYHGGYSGQGGLSGHGALIGHGSYDGGWGNVGVQAGLNGLGVNTGGLGIKKSPYGPMPDIKISFPGHYGEMSPLVIKNYGGCPAHKLPSNSAYQCRSEKCVISCSRDYEFSDGSKSYQIICMNGDWILPTNIESLHTCQATCKPDCQNGGICISPHKCQCSERFYGPLCQYQKDTKSCPSFKDSQKNIHKLRCNDRFCNIQCHRGFEFPDGSNFTNLNCVNGQWMDNKTGRLGVPDCKPICRPPCSHGGQCVGANVCKCPEKYFGTHCQYVVGTCSYEGLFLGNVSCKDLPDKSGLKCKFACLQIPGTKVEGSLDTDYICKYEVNKFNPPLPKCIYPPGYTIQMGPVKQYIITTYQQKRERIISKYRTYVEKRRTEMISSEEVVTDWPSYSLYITSDASFVADALPQRAMCTTWGGKHVKTFDGLMLKTPLSCWHTLVIDKQDGTFDITVKACPSGSGYGCAHTIKILWQSDVYTFRNLNGTIEVSTSSRRWPIPTLIKGMRVTPLPQRLQIELDMVGVTIDWDKRQYLSISVGPQLWSKLGGLCGSWDGDNRNDLMSPREVELQTVKTFADAWRVTGETDIGECEVGNGVEEKLSTTCDYAKQKEAIDICVRLLTSEKMENCTKLFDFDSLLKECLEDYCNCPNQEHPETCNCDTVEMLAKECSFNGVQFEHGWRNLEICPIDCGYQRVYLTCGPDVEPSCDSSLVPTKGKCNEGCFCPEGKVQYHDACILPELCPCTKGGKEFKPEATVKKQCNTCVCKSGKWNCTDDQCGARCGAIGDPHYQTFDGKRFDFMGKCSYHLLKMPQLSVEAENVACSGAISENMNFAVTSDDPSCTKSVTIRFTQRNGTPTTVRLGQSLVVSVNDKPVMNFPKVIGQGEMLIRHASSTFMTADFPDGMRIWWDGVSRVYIDAPPSYRNKTAGLCGTFNSNTEDDFLTPEGDIETAIQPFADKWRTKDTCLNKAESKDGPNPCTVNPALRKVAEERCAWITDDIFQECNWIVEPEQYYEDCMYDVCACKEDPAKCFCPILAAYGTECTRQGIQTGWHLAVKECAVKCPAGQIYDECGNSCLRTCDDLAYKNTCQRECVEGCRCPNGEFLNENNECVPQEKCPCVYEAVEFKPGYKEVRAGEKFLDLCTCMGGVWECQDAEPGDEEKYPPSSELRAKCNRKPFAEFLECAPTDRKTCKNMHDYVEDLEECKPGCGCMSGYVYDTSREACVLPEDCSCQHGGKSYSDGDQMKEDCNVCVCQSGKWKCSSQGCESTCSVWGDSHFTTFDHHDFDFQGTCNYVLAKGVADNGDGFTVTIQNVLCGTMGVTCSKSVEISITGSVVDTLTLTADSGYMTESAKTTINQLRDTINAKTHGEFHVYKVGVFIVVEVIPLSLQLKWDEGTRIYVKLGNEWRKKVSGLCGNYNDNAMDDMQTPSQSLETSALIFGHSWKVDQFCLAPTQPIDACKEHPEREMWAQLKCDVLKSTVFQACHGEVPVEKYLKRCIFDSCACDQGGDCECLCTAIAAYAHSCSQKGVSIRWRTPHLCPMQCDPHCSEYKSCTPPCPVETCDNFLDIGLADSLCNKENCIEGCAVKPCADGMIYLNDTFTECVPKSDCKPVCMLKEGITYYEGDVTYQDDCATCRCSKKKEVCSGQKCEKLIATERPAGFPTTPIMDTAGQPKCVRGWTRWFDKDTDTSTGVVRLNEAEKLPRYDRLEDTYGTCEKKYMQDIECRVVNTHEASDYMDENVSCDLEQGLVCKGQCHDYEIRAFCQCDDTPNTTPMPTERPGTECDIDMAKYKEFPGDCHKFLHCRRKPNGKRVYEVETCGTLMFNPISNTCDSVASVQQIKSECGGPPVGCPVGQVMSECANQCEHTCHFYGMILVKRGLCQEVDYCKPGCVPANRPNCPQIGQLWRDEDTCVEFDECPCMDGDEQYLKPNMPREYDLVTCQCIFNEYACAPNELPETTTETNVYDGSTEVTQMHETVFPTSITPPLECSPERLIALIEGNNPLPDTALSASSQRGSSYGPDKARLYMDSRQQTGSWSPSINDPMQYLQVTFPQPEPLFGVIMAGNAESNNYVKLFKILYSYDGIQYHYLTNGTDLPELFHGPPNGRKPIKALFQVPIEAKSVRFYPLRWQGSIAMRVELLGCGEEYITTTERIEVITIHPHQNQPPPDSDCIEEMGVENGKLTSTQVKASSTWFNPKSAKKPLLIDLLKLSSTVGWKPIVNTANEYIEFDFLEPRNISGIITKGGPEGWVTAYNVQYGRVKNIWNTMLQPDGAAKIYLANHDKNGEKVNYFKTPISTRYLKIKPTLWEKNINMRIEPVGCFIDYPVLPPEAHPAPTPPTAGESCLVCEGVTRRVTDPGVCECNNGLFWNGTACAGRNLCPCVDDIIYPVGSKFMNKACESCICRLGGQAGCKPAVCPPCGVNRRPIMSADCNCNCENCPKDHRFCKSFGDCMPEKFWCSNLKECGDGEYDELCITRYPENPRPPVIPNKCPVTTCPPGMEKVLKKSVAAKTSAMFTQTKKWVSFDGIKKKTFVQTQVVTSEEEFLPMPENFEDFSRPEEECEEFTCVPKGKDCPEPKCPKGYVIELDISSSQKGHCQKYNCTLPIKEDPQCEISGKFFKTFDGTEFKYDTCSHVLARDLLNSSWRISVHLQCEEEGRKICHRVVTIKDHQSPAELTMLPQKKLKFNSFQYTVSQLKNSPICKASFEVYESGNTVHVVSSKYKFWVRYDDIGHITIGLSPTNIRTVDGLCGYYDDNSKNDKRAPNGTVITNVAQFGDSWFDSKIPKKECDLQRCPKNLQHDALKLCNAIKHPGFKKCSKSVNEKQFLTKCVETTCECLMSHDGDANACKCKLLESYIQKCLAMNPNVQLTTWRTLQSCDISCPAPLVHYDCYKRRCEPSCETLDDDVCPIIPDMCFSGCYCPDGMVRKGETCVPVGDCKDCLCNYYGTSKYLTYDRHSFTFNGDCTYLLSRDLVLPRVHTFEIYVTMEDCQKLGLQTTSGDTSCAKALHLISGDHVVHVERQVATHSLRILIDSFEVERLPHKDGWIMVRNVNGKEAVISLLEFHVDLTVSFDDFSFSIAVPSIKYGSKMQGLCGDCDGNPNNDLIANSVRREGFKPSTELADVIQSWQANEPKLGLEANECRGENVTTTQCLPLPPEKDLCLQFYKKAALDQCLMIVDPANYILSCQQGMCHAGAGQMEVCDSLNAYAKECARHGICLDWRRPGVCPYLCPAGMEYKPCGCASTCDTVQALRNFDSYLIYNQTYVTDLSVEEELLQKCSDSESFEGCFCPIGKVLDKGKCVEVAQCLKCDDGEHLPGDQWKKDKCIKCSCDERGKTRCEEEKCLVQGNICAEGLRERRIQEHDECCSRYMCVPEPKNPTDTCLEPLMPECGEGQIKKQKLDSRGCEQYFCECKPKEDCDPLEPLNNLKPGQKVVQEDVGCCPTQRIICDKSICPKAPNSCSEEFYEVVAKKEPDDCCEHYVCEPPKDFCIVQNELNDNLSKYTLKVNGDWVHSRCSFERCVPGPNGFPQIITKPETCSDQCIKGHSYVHKDDEECCGECVSTACVFKDELYEPGDHWMSEDNCTTYHCVPQGEILIVTSSTKLCPDVSKCPKNLLVRDEEGCCETCKSPEEKSDNYTVLPKCYASSLAANETKDLVKLTHAEHGYCVNKEPIKGFTYCEGTCASGSKYSKDTFKHDQFCSCCKIASYKPISVNLICSDGALISKEIEIPDACACKPCSDSVEYTAPPATSQQITLTPTGQDILK